MQAMRPALLPDGKLCRPSVRPAAGRIATVYAPDIPVCHATQRISLQIIRTRPIAHTRLPIARRAGNAASLTGTGRRRPSTSQRRQTPPTRSQRGGARRDGRRPTNSTLEFWWICTQFAKYLPSRAQPFFWLVPSLSVCRLLWGIANYRIRPYRSVYKIS